MTAKHERGVKSTISVGGQPLHAMLVPFPIAFLLSLPLSDTLFWLSRDPFWSEVSFWLMVAGLVTGTAAAFFGRIDFLTIRRVKEDLSGFLHAGAGGFALLLTIVNLWRRIDDAVAAVVPWGLVLSAVTALLLLVANWFGGVLLFRYLIGAPGRERRKKP